MRPIRLALRCALLLATAAAATVQPPAGPTAGPTVRDVVEFTQIVQPRDESDDALREQVSPDGTRAFIVTRQADVAGDTNRYQIRLLDLRPDSLAAPQAPEPVTVFSAAVPHDDDQGDPAVQDVHWHGERTLVFLARLDGRSSQVYGLDLATRTLTPLTHETRRIVSYAASQDLRRVVYAVQVPRPPLREGEHAVVVGSQSFWSVKFGQDDLRAQRKAYRFFVADLASSRSPRPLGDAFAESNLVWPTVSLSPDGRWALLPRYEPQRLAAWSRRYPLLADAATRYAPSRQVDPLGYFSNTLSYAPRRMVAWRLADGQARTVVDAPDDALPGGPQLLPDRLWLGGGASVVLAGTHLPAPREGETAPASHVIEYWPDTGRWIDIAALQNRLGGLHALGDGFVVLDGARRRAFHRGPDGGWRESAEAAAGPKPGGPAWTLRTIQGLNRPPDVQATGPAGQTVRLTALNPQFDPDTWGTMRPYTWHDAAGRQWDGGLMSSRELDDHTRHPLLIQTYGFAPDRFYLDGPNIGDGASSAFAGRAFLRHGILVLALPLNPSGVPAARGPEALRVFNDGVRGAVDALVRDGRVDPSKVGIIGWSATGERVLNLVTFGDVPLRAATMADGDANTLFSLTVTYGRADTTWARKEAYNGGAPFGPGLAAWVRSDPALHTDCVRAALRIETYGPWVLNNWDVYALLRRQYKPVDMIVIPGGTHQLSTPGDRMASLQGNVDWYAFWLAGETRTVPLLDSETPASLAAQFAQWRQMQALKADDDARPPCARDGRLAARADPSP